MKFDRRNKNILFSWWWTIDRVALLALLCIMAFGTIMVATASPAVAERIGLTSSYFIERQLFFVGASLGVLLFFSFLSPLYIRRTAAVIFAVNIILLISVLIIGSAAKGAKRWLYLGGLSIQPSEFMKPCFICMSGWMLAEMKNRPDFPGFIISLIMYAMIATLLILQPDFGMAVVFTTIWGGQLFIAGLSLFWIFCAAIMLILGIIGAYFFLPHVTQRINSFLNSSPDGNYQVQKSLEAFSNGGIAGVGPGEGRVKQFLPDSHTDFIFSVVGEELGLISCIIVVIIFGLIIVRGFIKLLEERDLFIVFTVSGLLIQFGIQAVINMGVTLHILPTKGMTLPFISYGGSSMLGMAMGMGMLLALTRKRYGINLSQLKKKKIAI